MFGKLESFGANKRDLWINSDLGSSGFKVILPGKSGDIQGGWRAEGHFSNKKSALFFIYLHCTDLFPDKLYILFHSLK